MSSINRLKMIATTIFSICLLPLSIVLAAEPIVIPDSSLLQDGQAYFNSANYQTSIQSIDNLSHLAKAQSHVGEDAAAYGFAVKSDESKFFIIGTLYSEALAHLNGSKLDLATDRLEAIEKQFIALQTPSALYNYVSKVRSRVALANYSEAALLDMLSFFQPFFEAYAQRLKKDKLILFRAGSWLTDMSLTAAAKNKALLRLAKPQLAYFTKEMKRMDAPKGVLKAYQKISQVVGKKEINNGDLQRILKEIKRIKTILG